MHVGPPGAFGFKGKALAGSDEGLSSMNRPAASAGPSGSKGERPRAISSALTSSWISRRRGTIAEVELLFPAPLGPPMMTISVERAGPFAPKSNGLNNIDVEWQVHEKI
jgi:hypothetical protein